MLKVLRSFWRRLKSKEVRQRFEDVEKEAREILRQEEVEIKGPVDFAETILRMKPFPYQVRLLEDESKRIVGCMGRQSGKT
ncbi:MAG: hypothetical protein QMD13_10305, partial [Candidatus Bathyarchaeia archaeon]|nr:hypothetical protein [Candidatus Bathyarchaeia archaeon]